MGNTSIGFYLTWSSNPIDVCNKGDEYPGDDLDLLINMGARGWMISVSALNSTEADQPRLLKFQLLSIL